MFRRAPRKHVRPFLTFIQEHRKRDVIHISTHKGHMVHKQLIQHRK